MAESLPTYAPLPCLVVNLSRVERMNSGFLAGLVGLNKSLRRTGGKLVLCNLSVVIREVLNCTQLYQLFEIVENENEAMEACGCEPAGKSTGTRPSDQR
ncbi:MAG: STAS domain-containing protein [Planctomycetes bacterium]|nr:STAS domain-containing protein [Planctomycetota bacterium]